MYLKFQIKVPAIIESIVVYFLLRYRKKKYGYPFRKIKLTQGQYTIVDPEDFDELNQYKWFSKRCPHTIYAQRKENRKTVSMHRQVMRATKGVFVDHKNRDGLDNRKDNLRFATAAQNNCNSLRGFYNGRSKYKGVELDKKTNRWRATIYFENKKIHLGMFETEKEAAEAYDRAAAKYHGEFALRNSDIFKSDGLSTVLNFG